MGILKKVYFYFSSMKTGLVLLALIALASVLGSLILPDVFFRSVIFNVLLTLLILNMLLCTAKRIVRFHWREYTLNKIRFVRQLGILLLHWGIIMIFTGAAFYLEFGQSEILKLSEGETADISKLISAAKPFSIQLEQFLVTYNDNGSASQYYSNILILAVQKEKACISVNNPLVYGNVKAYQESYGNKVNITINDQGKKKVEHSLDEGQTFAVPGTEKTVKLFRYVPNFDENFGMESKSQRPDNPRVIFSVYEKGKLLGVGVAKIGETINLDNGVTVIFTGIIPYTVLKLKYDPGLPVTAVGGILFMLGVFMALLSVNSLPIPNTGSEEELDTKE